MDAATHLGAEHVVDETMLGDAAEPGEGGCRDDGAEMMTIAADLGSSAGNPRLDPLPQLLRGGLSGRHDPKRSERAPSLYLLKQ